MTPIEARNELVKIIKSQVGVKEIGGNNRGPKIVQYQKATWLDPAAWPWCAAFVDWCICEWLKVPEVRAALGITDSEAWRPKTAGAWDLANWAKSRKLEILGETAPVRAGDIIIFDFSHVGFAIEDAATGAGCIVTVEGNTNGAGDRDSTTGDGVWSKKRARALAKQFIRLI